MSTGRLGVLVWDALRSLKVRLTLIGVALIAASVALTVMLVLNDVGRRTEQVTLDASLDEVRRSARLLSSRVVSRQLVLGSAARGLPPGQLGDAAAMKAHLDSNAGLSSLFDRSFIALPDGRVFAWRNGMAQPDASRLLAAQGFLQRALQDGRPTISEAVVDPESAEPVLYFAQPVRDGGGKVVAVLGAGLRLLQRGALVEFTDGSDDDLVASVLTDANGRILAHPDRNWLLRSVAEEPRLAEAARRWNEQGQPLEPQGQARRAGEHLVALAAVPDADWVLWRSARADQMLGGLQAGRQSALLLGAAVAVVGGSLLLLAIVVMLAPLRQLERRARRLLDEDSQDGAGWPSAGGELGRLSAVFREAMKSRAEAASGERELLGKMQALMARSPVGIAFTREGRFDLVSDKFARLFGYDEVVLRGEAARLLYASEANYEELGARVREAFGSGQPHEEEVEFVRRDGSRFWGKLQGAPVRWGDTAAGTIWIVEDVSAARRERQALSWTSTHDALTELANRREFERRIVEVLGNRRREPVSALFIDLDHFKAVNDTAGHAAGDRMLQQVAQLLSVKVRGSDLVARIGGDEFAVLLASCDRHHAAAIATKMCAAVAGYRLRHDGHELQVGASIGVVELDPSLPDMASVLAAADAACYEAKRAGRNGVVVHGQASLRLVKSVDS